MSKPHRIESLLKDDGNGGTAWAASYSVTALAIGAFASGVSNDTTIPVLAGHAVRVDDYIMVGVDVTTYRLVTVVTATQITVASNVDVVAGSIIVNLGLDTGGATPDYLGSPVTITDDDGTAISYSTVTANAQGVYEYRFDGSNLWELIRNSGGVPIKVVTGICDNTEGNRVAFTDQDATPSVYMGANYQTANTVATIITMFDGGYLNQNITVHINDAYTTIDFTGTNLEGNGGADWYPANGSMLTAWFNGTKWVCTVTDVEGVTL